jgi:hypothetical protein
VEEILIQADVLSNWLLEAGYNELEADQIIQELWEKTQEHNANEGRNG